MYKNIESYILKIKFLLVLLFLSISNLTAQTIRINEVVSSNSQHTDEDGDTPDWLELHNYGTENISISNWALTDDEDDLTKWTFPSFTLAPDQYLLIWASKKDRSSAANELHTNFKISSSLETLTLTNTSGTFVDQITAENLTPDTSIGVSINSGTLVVFSETTPGDENSNNEYQGTIQSEVVFSHEGGLVGGPISLVLSGNTSGEEIRYTIGGNTTTETATLYTSPIAINANTSVRAQIFAENHIPSPVYTKSYILNANHEIDVMLLTTDPDDFFDEDTGIYVFGPNDPGDFPYRGANFWKDWERPIHFAFYENGENTSVEFNAGVKIFGGWSRANRQRSLALFARSQYGDSKFEHSFFDELNYNEFESLVLRNSGLDWLRTQMKDIALSSLMRGSGLDFQEHTPVATYLNGEYWGMYNLREKVNEHMLASKYNIDADDITLLDDDAVEDESNAEYNQLINYLSTTDLTIDSNFEYVAQEIDIEQYVLYHATEIFFNNNDWPGNNIKFWKYPEGKWRWVMFDTDNGFRGWSGNALNRALADDGPDHPNPPESTLPFRRLVTNIGFRNIFINRYADELNTRFLPHKVKAHIDQTYSTIQSEVNAHFQRWNSDIARVTLYMNEMKTFADNRPTVAKNRIKSNFNLPAYHTITIINPEIPEGFVEVNSNLNIQEASWTGDYFETVPIQLKATAESGFEFSHWSGDISSTDETISLTLVSNLEVTPNFSPTSSNDAIVINEINYKSSDSFDANDWVELYNPNTTSVDLANWELKDNNDSNIFILPEGTTIDAGGYIVLVKNSSDFSSVFPEITNFIGDIDFGFGSSDAVRLFDVNSLLQDEVNYLSEAPWSDCADETGNTLQLITPDLDNALPDSWSCINSNGSPNAINGSPVAQDPIAEAGSNKVITLPTNSITFNGSGIDPDGGAIVSYAWTQESGPSTTTLNEASTTALTTNDLEEGTYVFRLTVVDDEGDSSFDEVSVVVYPEASSVNIVGSANLVDATYLEGSRNPSPTGPILRAEGGNREIYLKFDLSSFKDQIVQVELSMQVSSDPGNGTLEVFLGSDSNWTETGLNGTNKPVAVSSAIASISGSHSLGQTKTWNLDASQIAGGGFITLMVKHSTGNDVAFASDETNQAPELIITTTSAQDPCASITVSIEESGPFLESDTAQQLSATPVGGVWSGDVSSSGLFDPSQGVGNYTATYTYTEGDCIASSTLMITVEASDNTIEVVGSANLIDATYLEGSRNPSPTGPILRAEGGNREIYLKFDLSSFKDQIVQVELSMQVSSDPGNGTLEVFLGSDSNWTEMGLNGTNKPVAVGSAIASISGSHSLGQTKTWNLDASQIAGGGFITLMVKHSTGNDVAFASDETNQAPELIITTTSAQDPCASITVSIEESGPFLESDTAQQLSATPVGGVWSGDVSSSGLFYPSQGVGNYTAIYTNTEGDCIASSTLMITVEASDNTIEVVGSANLIDATYLEGSRNPSPTGPILRAEGGNRKIYLKFDLSSFKDQIVQVELSMQVSSDPGNGTLEVFLGSDSNWTETGLNGTNKPVAVGSAIASISGSHSLGQTKTWNLDASQIAGGGFITLMVKHSTGNDVAFASDETNLAPELIITTVSSQLRRFNLLSVTPNPASTSTTLRFEEPVELRMIQVFDVMGRLITTYDGVNVSNGGAYVLDINSISAGTYFIRSYDNDGFSYQKQMVIEK